MIIDPFNCSIDDTGREQVIHGSSDFPIACYYNDLVLLPVLLHWHEELEAGIVTEGQALISIGNEKHILKEGEGFFINTGVLHDAYALEGKSCKIHSIVFHPRLVGGFPDSVFYRRYLRPLLEDPTLDWILLHHREDWHQDALRAIEDTWNLCRDELSGFEFSVRNALSGLTWQIHCHAELIRSSPSHKSLRDAERIKLMLTFIHENFSGSISIRSIAASAAISESEALRCFRNSIGTTPIQYLKQHRLRQSAMQLLSSNDRISEIAVRCGFQDMSYFTKSFREHYGCAPSDYRISKSYCNDHRKDPI